MHPLRLATAVLLVLAIGAPAAAARGLRSLGPIYGGAPTASVDEFAWSTGDGTVRYRDSRTGAEFAFVITCFPYDVGAGRILLGCRRPYEEPIEPYIAATATGRIDRVPGAEPGDVYGWLGAFWLRGFSCNAGHPDACGQLSLNWRTGERLTYGVDPDRRDPVPFVPPPDRLRLAGPASRNPPSRGPLLLRRRGRPDIVLSRCRGGCSHWSVFYGRVLWLQGGRVHGYTPATRRRRSVALPAGAGGRVQSVYGNSHELAVTTGDILFVAPWPR